MRILFSSHSHERPHGKYYCTTENSKFGSSLEDIRSNGLLSSLPTTVAAIAEQVEHRTRTTVTNSSRMVTGAVRLRSVMVIGAWIKAALMSLLMSIWIRDDWSQQLGADDH